MKRTYLILMLLCVALSLSSLPPLIQEIATRGFGGANYGRLIPVILGLWSFAMWRRSR